MADSKASEKRILAAERRTQALDLRKQGKTYTEIGAALGCSEQRAHKIVTEELRRLNEHRAEQATEVARLELERLDALLAGVWEKAKGGDGPAIDRVLAVMNRRAKLLGIDAPEKRELTGKDGRAMRLSLEDVVEADRQLEEWEHDRLQAPGGGTLPPGDPQVPA